nr:chromate transporter [Lachnospiraceae bacterium]
GPLAVNMATFIGSTQGGVLGSLVATFGVVLPSFLIILLIAAVIRNLLKYKGVQGFLKGVRPGVIGLILATAITLFFSTLFNVTDFHSTPNVNIKGIFIFLLLIGCDFLYKKKRQKKLSPIFMIVLSAFFGILFYSF